jgi:hypothetical protein
MMDKRKNDEKPKRSGGMTDEERIEYIYELSVLEDTPIILKSDEDIFMMECSTGFAPGMAALPDQQGLKWIGMYSGKKVLVDK